MKLKNIVAALSLLAAISGNAFAGSTSGTIPIGATVSSGCLLGTTGASITAGPFTSIELKMATVYNTGPVATGSVSAEVECSTGIAWSMSYTSQKIIGASGIQLNFYKDAGMTSNTPLVGVGNDSPQPATLYYKIWANSTSPTLGAFSENTTLTLTW